MKKKVWLSVILTLGLFQIGFGQSVTTVPAKITSDATPPEIQRSGYLVGPGDEITGKVLGEPQFDFVATIDEDGKFQVPFFNNSVMAKCKTERELTNNVTQLLAKYLKTPMVSVNVTKRESRAPAMIYGEVVKPQQVILNRKARLLDLLAFAGGVTEKSGGAIQVFHTQPPICEEAYEDGTTPTGSGADIPYRVYSLNTVQRGSDESNPVIYPGDIVIVKEASPVFVIGEVVATGKVLMPEGGLPLSQALANVGGVRPEAKIKDIKIQRVKANSKDREVISVNYDLVRKGKEKDVMLSPYDIVEVGKAKKSIGQILLEIAIGSAKNAGQVLPTTVLRGY